METTVWENSTNCSCRYRVSGEKFTCSSAAVENGLALDCWSNKRSSGTVVLWGLPDLGLSWTSSVSLNLCLILSTWRLDTLKMSATSAADLVFRFLMISTLVCGWIFGMLSGQVTLQMKSWCGGVLFIHTWECVTYSICHRWSSNLWLVESFKDRTRLLTLQKQKLWALPSCEYQDTLMVSFGTQLLMWQPLTLK